MQRKISIKILGQELPLKTDQSPEYIEELVEYITRKFEEVSEKTGLVDTNKRLLLTALNLAEDLFQTRKKLTQLEREVERKADNLLKRMGL